MIDEPNPDMPPGFENFAVVIDWVSWAAILVCFIGFIVSGAKVAIAYRNNEMEGAKGLVLALIGCLLVGGAATIINRVTGG